MIERALRSMYQDYSRALLREAWLALHDSDAARDLLQETLLKAWRACAGFRGDSELYPWLQGILRRGAIDRLRRHRPEVDIASVAEPDSQASLWPASGQDADSQSPQGQLELRQSREVFMRCAQRFAAEQPQAADVIRWVVEDGLAPADIAKLLQRSPGATREHISQCRKKARLYFADWYALVGSPTADELAAAPPGGQAPAPPAAQPPGPAQALPEGAAAAARSTR